MTKPMPAVHAYMSTSPHSIGVDQTVAHAKLMMREYAVRHLAVLSAGKLVGVLTDRDIDVIESIPDVDPRKVKVEEAMASEVYAVSPDSPLNEAVSEMAKHEYGSAVVMQSGKVIGMFTAIDACRAFAELFPATNGK